MPVIDVIPFIFICKYLTKVEAPGYVAMSHFLINPLNMLPIYVSMSHVLFFSDIFHLILLACVGSMFCVDSDKKISPVGA